MRYLVLPVMVLNQLWMPILGDMTVDLGLNNIYDQFCPKYKQSIIHYHPGVDHNHM